MNIIERDKCWAKILRLKGQIRALDSVSECDPGQWDIQGGERMVRQLKELEVEFERKYTVRA